MAKEIFKKIILNKFLIKNSLKSTTGINIFWSVIFSKRVEWILYFNVYKNNLNNQLLNWLFLQYCCVNKIIKLVNYLSILILDFVWNYRGVRHIKGLPVRGQRTWNNAWTTFRANSWLRSIRLKWALKYYTNVSKRDARIGMYAEYNNLLWKRQWRFNWFFAKAKRLNNLKSKKILSQEIFKIDIKNIAEGRIFLPSIKRELTKKQKTLQEKSIYAVGYDLGFSKVFYKALLKRKSFKK